MAHPSKMETAALAIGALSLVLVLVGGAYMYHLIDKNSILIAALTELAGMHHNALQHIAIHTDVDLDNIGDDEGAELRMRRLASDPE